MQYRDSPRLRAPYDIYYDKVICGHFPEDLPQWLAVVWLGFMFWNPYRILIDTPRGFYLFGSNLVSPEASPTVWMIVRAGYLAIFLLPGLMAAMYAVFVAGGMGKTDSVRHVRLPWRNSLVQLIICGIALLPLTVALEHQMSQLSFGQSLFGRGITSLFDEFQNLRVWNTSPWLLLSVAATLLLLVVYTVLADGLMKQRWQ